MIFNNNNNNNNNRRFYSLSDRGLYRPLFTGTRLTYLNELFCHCQKLKLREALIKPSKYLKCLQVQSDIQEVNDLFVDRNEIQGQAIVLE